MVRKFLSTQFVKNLSINPITIYQKKHLPVWRLLNCLSPVLAEGCICFNYESFIEKNVPCDDRANYCNSLCLSRIEEACAETDRYSSTAY